MTENRYKNNRFTTSFMYTRTDTCKIYIYKLRDLLLFRQMLIHGQDKEVGSRTQDYSLVACHPQLLHAAGRSLRSGEELRLRHILLQSALDQTALGLGLHGVCFS